MRQWAIGCYLAGAINYRTGEVALTLRALADGIRWEKSEDTLGRELQALRPAWIEFETKQGQRTPILFKLTGLIVGDEPPPPHDFRTETPFPAEVTAELRTSEHPSTSQPERDSGPAEPPQSGSPKKRREEKRRKNFSEGGKESLLGEGTRGENDQFLAALRGVNAHPPVRVEVDEDGSLRWSSEPREGEQGFLDDCQALVDAGIATWLEGPA